jgi:hypothetical protein
MLDFNALHQSMLNRVAVGHLEVSAKQLMGSDIVLHLPVLEYYASLCEHVTELGVREGCSTTAFIAGCPGTVHSCDILRSPNVDLLASMKLPCRQWLFTEMDTGSAEQASKIGETDLLFFDTLHTYDHLSNELALHGRKARSFLAFHDTYTCAELDVSGPNPKARGIMPAIVEFLDRYPDYKTVYRTTRNNGLWVLQRI